MKKLIVIACGVALAAVAQAGSVTWSMTNVYLGNEEDLASGNAYLFGYKDGTTPTYTTTTIIGAIQDAFDKGYNSKTGADGVKEFLNANALGKNGTAYTWTPATAGAYGNPGTVDNKDLGFAGEQKYYMFGVIFDDEAADISADSTFFVTAEKSATTKGDDSSYSSNFNFLSQKTRSQVADNWNQVGSAPEPTSGLLLLLGVAGLALRRRRA